MPCGVDSLALANRAFCSYRISRTVACLELNVMVLGVNRSRNIVHIEAVVVVSSISPLNFMNALPVQI